MEASEMRNQAIATQMNAIGGVGACKSIEASPVQSEIDTLSSRIAALDQTLGQIAQRLVPVLAPAPAPPGLESGGNGGVCPIHTDLQSIRLRVESMVEGGNALLAALAI